jgi:restriction system protein
MEKRNPESPWNPTRPADVTPGEYEKQVVSWLKASSNSLDRVDIRHLKHLEGSGGDYEFDAVAELTVFEGAKVTVLVECKRYSRPVEREKVLALWAKLQDVGAHKAMMFATCGYQCGALKYAKRYGIATVIFVDGAFLYETKATTSASEPPPWVDLPKFAGILTYEDDGTIHCSQISSERIEPLSQWLNT